MKAPRIGLGVAEGDEWRCRNRGMPSQLRKHYSRSQHAEAFTTSQATVVHDPSLVLLRDASTRSIDYRQTPGIL